MDDARKRTLRRVGRHLCYLALMLLCYVLQTTPGLFCIFGVKPVLLVALAVLICTRENEFVSALYGTLAGLYWELAAGRTIGSLSIFLLILCFGCSILFMLYLRASLRNVSLLVGLVTLILCSIDFVFSYWLREGSGVDLIYLYRILPTVAYTALLTFAVRWPVQAVGRHFAEEN